jgi:predicted metal-dependent TIM-barrel fold hydrolase
MTAKKNQNDCKTMEKTGTRDAVETAIDLSKEKKSNTWESSVKKSRTITRWDAADSYSIPDEK